MTNDIRYLDLYSEEDYQKAIRELSEKSGMYAKAKPKNPPVDTEWIIYLMGIIQELQEEIDGLQYTMCYGENS